jgi:hypothetical protein
VLPPVHDADDDGARVRGDLDEIEAGFLGCAPCFFDGNDADLLAVGADETNGTQTDLVVDAYPLFDSAPPLPRLRIG